MAARSHVTIIEANSPADIKAFLELPYALYEGEVAWHPPLRFERKAQLSGKTNPDVKTLTRQLFLAKRGKDVVGRIAAFINPAHRDYHKDGAGHFGYFDCEPDFNTGAKLLETAEIWLKSAQCKKMIGPASHSVNEECGLLVDGFEYPPILMMPYGRSDYQPMVEAAGFEKAIDMLAFNADLHGGFPRPKTALTMVNYARKDPSISFRSMDIRNFKDEVALAMRIMNDAWSENWGFIPISDAQINHMAKELKPLIFPEGFRVGMIDGKPVGFVWMIPNLNEAIRDLNGRLLPLGWLKLVSRLKISGVKTARIPLMGITKEFQKTRQGLAVVAALCEDVFAAGREKGFTHCELSWILDTNKSMIRICEQASAVPYKTYRMYEKKL